MCDEYDDERMRVFWRQIAMREAESDLDEERERLGEPLEKPAIEIAPPETRRARALIR